MACFFRRLHCFVLWLPRQTCSGLRQGARKGDHRQVETLKQKDPIGYSKKNATKRLAAIAKPAFEVIPQDPARPEYRQGNTLGEAHKHWFRAKFFQQYRLFFRYHAPSRIIVYAWVSDEDSKRAYESSYRVFRKMLESGRPPDDWDRLWLKPVANRAGCSRS